MKDSTLMHVAELEIGGTSYPMSVYCRKDGRYFALTRLTGKDIIISDGCSPEAALARHREALPLAVDSRMILREFQRNCVMPRDNPF